MNAMQYLNCHLTYNRILAIINELTSFNFIYLDNLIKMFPLCVVKRL